MHWPICSDQLPVKYRQSISEVLVKGRSSIGEVSVMYRSSAGHVPGMHRSSINGPRLHWSTRLSVDYRSTTGRSMGN